MSDFFKYSAEPMDIEGEAVCAAVIQGVTARGEQGPAVDENVGFGNQSDSPLLSDEGEPTDDQDQVIADAHDRFAKTAAALIAAAQVVKVQREGATGAQSGVVGVQDARGGLNPSDNLAIHDNNDVFIEGGSVPGRSLVPYLLAPPCDR